jgi:glycerol uptake facilitator-like aquaporin
MNPSLAMGLNMSRFLVEGYNPGIQYLYVYLIFPIIGSLVGTLFFDYVYCPCLAKSRELQQS